MKVVICGAGIAGLAAARFLGEAGWEVTLLEKAPGLRTAGYMIDFAGSGYDAAERDGFLPALQARHHDFDEVTYVNGDGRERSKINYRLARAAMHGRLLALLRGDVETVLHDALPEHVDIRYGTTVETLDSRPDGVEAVLSDGSRIAADLLVGADGIHSDTRARIFGPEADYLRFLGYHTAAFLFEDRELAREIEGQFRMVSVPNRQVGCYDIGGGHIAAFFAHTAASGERPANPAAELRDVYGGLGWQVPRMLDAAQQADDLYYDVVAQIEMPRWHQDRIVLLGDAAYAVSLLAGQGASMAIGGAYTLAQYLARYDINEALNRFEAEIKPEIEKKQAAGRRTANWFVPPTEFHNVVRDLFLNLTRVPGLTGLLGKFFEPSFKSVIRK